jgi:hypothetical protein
VIVLWVTDEGEKLAMVQDESSPFFTTPHFDAHPSVLLRTRASAARRTAWLDEHCR